MSQWTQLSWYVAIALIVVIMGAAAVTLWLIAAGNINIKNMLEEPDSQKASLSRFQFLIFTFVVAGLFLLLSIESGTFVTVPNSVLMLIGISAEKSCPRASRPVPRAAPRPTPPPTQLPPPQAQPPPRFMPRLRAQPPTL